MENLAWACPGCNLHKSDRVEIAAAGAADPVPLFNPRLHRWTDHLAWDSYAVRGLTAIGRVTLVALNMNDPRRLRIRQAEELFGLFPPDD